MSVRVPTADVFEALRLVRKLASLAPGEAVDHKWGFVRREQAARDATGFRLADPGQSGAQGVWRANVVDLVDEMYEAHLNRTYGEAEPA